MCKTSKKNNGMAEHWKSWASAFSLLNKIEAKFSCLKSAERKSHEKFINLTHIVIDMSAIYT